MRLLGLWEKRKRREERRELLVRLWLRRRRRIDQVFEGKFNSFWFNFLKATDT